MTNEPKKSDCSVCVYAGKHECIEHRQTMSEEVACECHCHLEFHGGPVNGDCCTRAQENNDTCKHCHPQKEVECKACKCEGDFEGCLHNHTCKPQDEAKGLLEDWEKKFDERFKYIFWPKDPDFGAENVKNAMTIKIYIKNLLMKQCSKDAKIVKEERQYCEFKISQGADLSKKVLEKLEIVEQKILNQ